MDLLTRLCIMLIAGLIARHATMKIGKRLAEGKKLYIPKLCAYATAGCTAAIFKMGLKTTSLDEIVIYILFGTMWGVIVGLMLPFGKKERANASS